ncbi:Hypothetical protein NTJ_10385 [Nesidiocoris tenuis]|uniref:Uncharacterized protein n=1 Tax=Nesidiocoris tenuis TaxID=355587 RepID=A0ABN7AZH3_9HEMI|nr:Hypothetical protein NTJ_10385 [Nesidiocoris tenuis]
MSKRMSILCLLGACVLSVAAEDKWVWSGSSRSAKLSRDPSGRYGVFEEPDLPDEPYSPIVRPPPSNLPPLVRPTAPSDKASAGFAVVGLGAYYTRPGSGSDRLPPNFSFERPGGFDRPGGFVRPGGYDRPGGFDRPGGIDRPYDRLPGTYPTPTNPSFRPPPPSPIPGGLINSGIDDPTKFDKCKCTHSFNCKSPGIVFGSCDVGKKYCCEKRITHSNGIPVGDGPLPEVLAGPGGPVDQLRGQGPYSNRGNPYVEPRRP